MRAIAVVNDMNKEIKYWKINILHSGDGQTEGEGNEEKDVGIVVPKHKSKAGYITK